MSAKEKKTCHPIVRAQDTFHDCQDFQYTFQDNREMENSHESNTIFQNEVTNLRDQCPSNCSSTNENLIPPNSCLTVSFCSLVQSTSNKRSHSNKDLVSNSNSCSNTTISAGFNEILDEPTNINFDIDIENFKQMKTSISSQTFMFLPEEQKLYNSSSGYITSENQDQYKGFDFYLKSDLSSQDSKKSPSNSSNTTKSKLLEYLMKPFANFWNPTTDEKTSVETNSNPSTFVQINVIHSDQQKEFKCNVCSQSQSCSKYEDSPKLVKSQAEHESLIFKVSDQGTSKTVRESREMETITRIFTSSPKSQASENDEILRDFPNTSERNIDLLTPSDNACIQSTCSKQTFPAQPRKEQSVSEMINNVDPNSEEVLSNIGKPQKDSQVELRKKYLRIIDSSQSYGSENESDTETGPTVQRDSKEENSVFSFSPTAIDVQSSNILISTPAKQVNKTKNSSTKGVSKTKGTCVESHTPSNIEYNKKDGKNQEYLQLSQRHKSTPEIIESPISAEAVSRVKKSRKISEIKLGEQASKGETSPQLVETVTDHASSFSENCDRKIEDTTVAAKGKNVKGMPSTTKCVNKNKNASRKSKRWTLDKNVVDSARLDVESNQNVISKKKSHLCEEQISPHGVVIQEYPKQTGVLLRNRSRKSLKVKLGKVYSKENDICEIENETENEPPVFETIRGSKMSTGRATDKNKKSTKKTTSTKLVNEATKLSGDLRSTLEINSEPHSHSDIEYERGGRSNETSSQPSAQIHTTGLIKHHVTTMRESLPQVTKQNKVFKSGPLFSTETETKIIFPNTMKEVSPKKMVDLSQSLPIFNRSPETPFNLKENFNQCKEVKLLRAQKGGLSTNVKPPSIRSSLNTDVHSRSLEIQLNRRSLGENPAHINTVPGDTNREQADGSIKPKRKTTCRMRLPRKSTPS